MKVHTISVEELSLGKRTSAIKRGEILGIILSARLRLESSSKDKQSEIELMEFAKQYRKSHHEPPAHTLGSVFAERVAKKSWKHFLFLLGIIVMRLLYIENRERVKKWRLWLYGYMDIYEHVSVMNVNTFIWKQDSSHLLHKFMRYIDFMNKIYDNPKLEIEIRK